MSVHARPQSSDPGTHLIGAVLVRSAVFFGFWLTLAGMRLTDLLPGIFAATAATAASIKLLPPGPTRLSPLTCLQFASRFLQQSAIAGIDVARLAFDPKLPLRPGFVRYACNLPEGTSRDTFITLSSLMPGTLPVASEADGHIVIHCLDVDQPVVEQLAIDEALLARALGIGSADG